MTHAAGDNARALCARAQALIDVGRSADAVVLLHQAAAADPQALEPRCLLALALLKLDRFAEALRAAEEGAGLDPSSEWPHRLRSIILLRLGKAREALAAAREAVRLAPELPETLHCLANAELRNGDARAARRSAEHLVAAGPDRAMSHRMLGSIALSERRWHEAEGHYRKALALEPECWEAMNNLGVSLQNQGKKKDAIEAFHSAARLNPTKELSRKNLLESVGGYVGGGFLLFWIAAQVLFRLGGGGLEQLPPSARGAAAAGLVALGAAIVGGYLLWRRRRIEQLHPTVAVFYRDEMRRKWIQLAKALSAILALGAGATATLVRTVLWAKHGPAEAGLESWGLALYVLIAVGTVSGLIFTLRMMRRGCAVERH